MIVERFLCLVRDGLYVLGSEGLHGQHSGTGGRAMPSLPQKPLTLVISTVEFVGSLCDSAEIPWALHHVANTRISIS